MFGKSKKRLALIKELAETRFTLRGSSSTEVNLMVKSLGTLRAMALPEATLVVILEGVVKAQKQGVPLAQVLMRFERQRSLHNHDQNIFSEIILRANGDDPATAMVDYLHYRNQMEAPPDGKLSWDEIAQMVVIAYQEINRW